MLKKHKPSFAKLGAILAGAIVSGSALAGDGTADRLATSEREP